VGEEGEDSKKSEWWDNLAPDKATSDVGGRSVWHSEIRT